MSKLQRRIANLEARMQPRRASYLVAVYMSAQDFDAWMDPSTSPEREREILGPYGIGPLQPQERIIAWAITVVDGPGEAAEVHDVTDSPVVRRWPRRFVEWAVNDLREGFHARDLDPPSTGHRPAHWHQPTLPSRSWTSGTGIGVIRGVALGDQEPPEEEEPDEAGSADV